MNSGLDDLVTIVEWLAATKTPPIAVAAAFERLRARAKNHIPADVKISDGNFKDLVRHRDDDIDDS